MKIVVTEGRVQRMVRDVLKHKPETWSSYEHERDGLFDIIGMEAEELEKARKEGTHKQIIVALSHLAAATQQALDKMTCP